MNQTYFTMLRAGIPVLLFFSTITGQAAPPDLTAGGVPGDSLTTNLGPTGARGWVYHVKQNSSESRQIQVKSVAAGSPSDGILAINDVILGANGTGAAPANFTYDARKALADAINAAEARNPATLKLIRWRAGTTSTQEITLQTLGAYSATAPYNCPKSALILQQGLQAIMDGESAGRYSFGLLTLLAGNDPLDPDNAARLARAQTEARAMIPNASTRAQMMSDVRDTASTWQRGHTLVALAEYYLVTGDSEILPAIEAYAVNIAKNTSLFGTVGHIFAEKFSDGSPNGPMGGVYGPVNSTGMPCLLGLLLARECGLANPEIEPAIIRSSRFFASFAGKGAIPYGEHEPFPAHENNGKSGLAALCFALEDNRVAEGKFYAKMASAAPSEREQGHTGAFFSYLWSPLGAAVGGEEAAALHFSRIRWMLDLNRRWDGKFDYDCLNGEGPNSGSTYHDFRMSTAALLVYALPLRQLHLTGRGHDPGLLLGSADLADAAAADTYTTTGRSIANLITDTGSWSPKIRRNAAIQLGTNKSSVTTSQRNELHSIANNTTLPAHVRAGACDALGRIANPASASVLANLLTDQENYVRYAAGEALRYLPNADRQAQLTKILTAAASNARPVLPFDEQDPLHFDHGRLAMLLFYGGNAYGPKGILWNNISGVDRNLLYPAIRAVAANPVGQARSCLASIYPLLTKADTQAVADAVVDSVLEYAPSDRMFAAGVREKGFDLMWKYDVAEGVPAGMKYIIEAKAGDRSAALGILKKYAASYTTITPEPDVIALANAYLNPTDGNSDQKIAVGAAAQAVLDAIAADTNPKTLVPFKVITSAAADHPQLTLPANSTILRVTSFDHAQGDSKYTWRKLLGPGAVSFSENGTAAGAASTIVIQPISGNYLFEVTMSDSRNLTELSETVALTLFNTDGVLPENFPPTAHPQTVTLKRGSSASFTLSATDPEGYQLYWSILSQPAHGTLTGTPPGMTYTPPPDFTGDDSFTFQVMDTGGEVSEATVSVIVLNTSPSIVLHESFDDATGNINGRNGGIGFGGAWSAKRNNPRIEMGSKTWGSLPATGNHVVGSAWSSLVRPLGTSLTDAGLMRNGATLWFSVVFDLEAQNFTNADLDFAIGTNQFVSTDYGTRENLTGGEGIGVTHLGGRIQGAYWRQNTGDAQAGRVVNNSTTLMTTGSSRALIVGKIEWGATDADPETLTLHTPNQNLALALPALAAWTIPAMDQSQFTLLALHFKDSPKMDEIRFSRSYYDVVAGITATPPVAHPQALMLDQGGSAPVSLTCETPGGGPPVFAVTRQPLHGLLSGSAPDLTYTPDPAFQGEDRLTFSVMDAGGFVDEAMVTFTVGPPQSGDYQVWAAQWPGADLGDPEADFNGDGMTNNEKRIWGLDPTSGASIQPVTAIPDPAGLTFTYTRRRPELTGMNFSVWTSTDLGSWTEDKDAVQTPGTPDAQHLETVDVTLSIAPPEGGRLFIQVRATPR